MLILGINDNGHDAAVSLIDGKNIFFAAHAERYSKVKNDWYLNQEIIDEVFSSFNKVLRPIVVFVAIKLFF